MAGTKTKPTAVAVTEFLAQVEEPAKRADSNLLIDMMQRVTGEAPAMWGGSIIGFGKYHYRYPSGHEGDAPLASFSPRKTEFSIYLCGMQEDDVRTALLQKLGRHRMGKGCLYVKRLADVDLEVLEQLVRQSADAAKAAYP